jgi:hypothetical protein
MTSETLVNIDQTTQRNNPEDRNLHTHRCDNLKSYINKPVCRYCGFYMQKVTIRCLFNQYGINAEFIKTFC